MGVNKFVHDKVKNRKTDLSLHGHIIMYSISLCAYIVQCSQYNVYCRTLAEMRQPLILTETIVDR